MTKNRELKTVLLEYDQPSPEKPGDRARWVLSTYRYNRLVKTTLTRVIVEPMEEGSPFRITRWVPMVDPSYTITVTGPHQRVTTKMMDSQHAEAVTKALAHLRDTLLAGQTVVPDESNLTLHTTVRG